MDRLTEWMDETCTEVSIVHYKMRDAMIRLAQYEDIGLAPEQLLEVDRLYTEKCREVAELKKQQRGVEGYMREINLNVTIKVKLTPLGANIYYHQYDDVPKVEPRMPQIDKDGYTRFQLWDFIHLYGKYIGMCKPEVIIGNAVFLEEGEE